MHLEPLFRLVDIENKLTFRFQNQEFPGQTALTGILLARPEDPFSKKEILPHLQYWHYRSGEYIDFFCVGYVPHLHVPDAQPVGVRFAGFEWAFSHEAFVEVLKHLELTTEFDYEGTTCLLLVNAMFDGQRARLDFDRSVQIDLESLSNGETPKQIAETLFRFAKDMNADIENPLWEYSDAVGKRILKQSILDSIKGVLPKALRANVDNALKFVVRKTSPETQRSNKASSNIVRVDFGSKPIT